MATSTENKGFIGKYLQQILGTLIVTGIISLFTWGITLNREMTLQKDDYDKTIATLTLRIDQLQKELNDVEKDNDDFQNELEAIKDDLKVRIIRLEDVKTCCVVK